MCYLEGGQGRGTNSGGSSCSPSDITWFSSSVIKMDIMKNKNLKKVMTISLDRLLLHYVLQREKYN